MLYNITATVIAYLPSNNSLHRCVIFFHYLGTCVTFDSVTYCAVCKMIYSLKSSGEGCGGVEYSNHSYTPNVAD